MLSHPTVSALAEQLVRAHVLNYYRAGRVIAGSFEALPGRSEAEVVAAYAELVGAGLMYPGRLAGVGDPGTFLLAPAAFRHWPV